MKETEFLTIPISAKIVIDKKGNVISKKITTKQVPLTDKLVVNFIKALGWDMNN